MTHILTNLSIVGELQKLRGLYFLTSKRCVVPMEIFQASIDNPLKDFSKANTIHIKRTAANNAGFTISPSEIKMKDSLLEEDLEKYSPPNEP